MWQLDAVCYGSALSAFPSTRYEAKTFIRTHCDHCPVAAQCLAFAKAHGEGNGVWGGTLFGKTVIQGSEGPQRGTGTGLRKHCIRGHNLTLPDAIYYRPSADGWECMVCRVLRQRQRKAAKAAAYAELRKAG